MESNFINKLIKLSSNEKIDLIDYIITINLFIYYSHLHL